jgi:glycine/D-amino acid oxidase-like deaminating enzyme
MLPGSGSSTSTAPSAPAETSPTLSSDPGLSIMTPSPAPTAYERNAPDPRLVAKTLASTRNSVFWLDDAPNPAAYPQLTYATKADLVIVGGGYLGLWSAVNAKRRDPARRVVLLEAKTTGWAASGRNGGFCEASITHGEGNGRTRWPEDFDLLDRLGNENLTAFGKDVATLNLDCQWEETGVLTVAVEPHQVDWIDGNDPALDGPETQRRINSPLFLGGTFDADHSALVHPARLAQELARVAVDLGVEIRENSPVIRVGTSRTGEVRVETARATVLADRAVLATNVFKPLLRRNRLMTVPVYDYVLMTEPLTATQLAEIGWTGREGLTDMANQFHYARLTADNRVLYGGYDAVYHAGGKIRAGYDDRPDTFARLASHFLATFPQLEDISFSHRWAGAIDTCTRFAAFYGLARRGRVAYAAGFTGLGVGATRFASEVLLDLLAGIQSERTNNAMVQQRPLPFPPEPAATLGINLTRWSLDRADHRQGRRNLFLRALDAAGLGFDS